MERFLLIATLSALVMAKPEMYREKEDFQYSRSSSDEGSKSGFYGAQRGNMGGNYERAHNMDGLAQHQMGGLVRQVQGELGEGSKTRTGSVFTAANSKGVYGSGNYDLSNLEGRNFQEGVSFDDSQSLSSLSSHAGDTVQSSATSNGGAYAARNSQGTRYHSGFNQYSGQSSKHSGQTYDNSLGYTGQVGQLQELDNTHAVRRHDYGGLEASGQYSQSSYHGQSLYDHSNTNSHSSSDYRVNTQNRHITEMPVRVVIRPGTKVPVPIAAQSLNTVHTDVAHDENLVNTDTEILNNQNHYNFYKPAGQPKHYESAYSYHKEWEKHGTKPVGVPTENPFPKNSELYEDTQAHLSGQQYDASVIGSQNSHLSNAYSGYNTKAQSTSYNQYQQQFNSKEKEKQVASSSSSDGNTYAGYNSGLNTDVYNQIENVNNKPKSYQSSYSYHKSWERQGDPYVIKPVNDVTGTQQSQKLTAASGDQNTWSSHQYGSRLQQNRQYHLNAEDCDCEEDLHKRVARSYNSNQQQQQETVYFNADEIGQQAENLGQQTQNKWENLEDLGQQTQNKWENLEDLGQQTQSKLDKLEESGQQTVNQWGDLETLGQQTQNQWDKLNEAGQQSQNRWDKLEDLGQQTQQQWNSIREEIRRKSRY